jgi:hypothetical protein
MAAYQTETPQQSAQYVNASFVNRIMSGQEKQAAEEGNAFIREYVRQEAAVREILPPQGLTDAEIDRMVNTDDPMKIVEKEPKSYATFVEFNGTPETYWFNGPRYAVYFGKITSPDFVKNKYQLMTYRTDIRKIIADNLVKDCADQEDAKFRQAIDQILAAGSTQVTGATAFTSAAFKNAQKALLKRRRPLGKMLMTQALYVECIDLPATSIGNEAAGKHYTDGFEHEDRLFGVPVIRTAKSHIYSDTRAYLFSPQDYLGNFYLLQDATLFIKQEAEIIQFRVYSAPGIGIGNRLSIQAIDFSL